MSRDLRVASLVREKERRVSPHTPTTREETGEVGVAALSLARPVLCLNQVSDNRQFETTLRIIRGYGATVVLFPTSHTQSALYSALVARSGAQVDTRPRRSFSEADGMEKIKQLSANELVSPP